MSGHGITTNLNNRLNYNHVEKIRDIVITLDGNVIY